jgi:hypothetical protein
LSQPLHTFSYGGDTGGVIFFGSTKSSRSALIFSLRQRMFQFSTAATARNIGGSYATIEVEVPLGVVESPLVTFKLSGTMFLGVVDAAGTTSWPALTVTRRYLRYLTRVRPGGTAVFRVNVTTSMTVSESTDTPQSGVAATFHWDGLARLLCVRAVLSSAPHTLLPFSANPSATAPGCVDILVPVPEDAPLGSLVTLHRVFGAGCDVSLGEAPLYVTVGHYNHAPAPEGPVTAAAKSGNVPALLAALDADGSTEERDEVSA